ncbi:2-amino-4-hydroxy-6-hydroxymethyldihydropteridine diphosphokinase [Moraxella sp. K127]|uniref:2-amino-4-hydroxy-6-hydroxymethyldihydropteridine diphosphokinase n=1 Tax=Moraxella lacunata TaxID=477 RepID=A0A1B8Q5L7_MORLA|nr:MULTISPECIES: 2-amino-4-hydroxy-6-hydroxymethyldihydropteridine diphosphokinase [Moraxella]MBE9590428.1 2-amino-4-hydroxy-6-hydroxymethyldihydropteridine diphosphokinase [Moraxella sp. K127]MDI4481801.1 hypothetical protein [Moraxella lacunata]MDI4506314.1 hypothetical protein [Moraxella lacunata]OBX63788.1 hypothetical protein A9Z63_04565 [Moraxella lacunata]OBX65043.1 hypothetical protein A9309_02990 [Moraxella lacunata]
MIHQYIIALGSNHDSEMSFKIALDELKSWGDVDLSSVIIGKDFTGKTELIYHNAVMMIKLYKPMNYDEFNDVLKNIEIQCGREHDNSFKKVPMDLDVLAYYENDKWFIIKKRLPFKNHEKTGLIEIAPFLLTD